MMIVCSYRWKREFAGLGKGISTFSVSAGIVAAFYVVLAIGFWGGMAMVVDQWSIAARELRGDLEEDVAG